MQADLFGYTTKSEPEQESKGASLWLFLSVLRFPGALLIGESCTPSLSLLLSSAQGMGCWLDAQTGDSDGAAR